MKKGFLTLLLLITILLPLSPCFAVDAGTVTQTYTPIYSSEGVTNLSTLTLAWTSDASGNVTATTSTTITDQIAGKYVVMVVTDPGATAPTDDYDITITDANGVDIMGGKLANRDTANTEQAMPYIGSDYSPRPISGALTLNISTAGDSKIGSVIIYLSRQR